MIIDTHAQLFTSDFIGAVKSGAISGLDAMGYAFFFKKEPVDTISDMDAAGVDISVVVAVDAETTAGYRIPNELLAEEVGKHPGRLVGFAGVDPHKGGAAAELERAIVELGLKGVKFICHLHELEPNHELYYPLYEVAQHHDVPVLHHTGTHYHFGKRMRYARPLYIDDVAVDFPELKLVIAHFGWPWCEEAIAVSMRHPNVFVNVAGWSPKYYPDVFVRYADGILSNKVLFGSDHPLLSRKRLIDELAGVAWKDETKRKVLSINPAGLLGLEVSDA